MHMARVNVLIRALGFMLAMAVHASALAEEVTIKHQGSH